MALILALMVSTPGHAQQPWTGIIASPRSTDWSTAGVVGGIPTNYTQCGSTVPAGTSAATISADLAACTANTYLLLGPGTFNLSTGITFGNKSNLILRGSGANQTFLVFTGSTGCYGIAADVCARSADLNYDQAPSNTANWTAGYSQGTTTITLSSVTNLKVGNPLFLDQIDDLSGSTTLAGRDTGQVFICDAGGTNGSDGCSENGPGNQEGGYQRGGGTNSVRDELQIVTVASCDGNSMVGHACTSGTNITITPGLRMPNWRSSQSPGAWWATSPVAYDGVEDLSIDGTSGGQYGVQLFNCASCWVKGIRSIAPGRAHVGLLYSNHDTVRDSYFFSTQNAAAESYGVENGAASDNLIENNIFQKVAAAQMTASDCEGCVFGYNFNINDWYSVSSGWDSQGAYKHSVVSYALWEGNQGDGLYFDLFHGTGHFITAFRNRYDGHTINNGTTTTGHTNPFIVYPYNRYHNIIGNVLGQSGYHTTYTFLQGQGGSEDVAIFVVGTGTVNCCQSGDNLTPTSLMRWGNYDTVNAAVRFVNAEVPSSFNDTSGSPSLFVNAVPSSQTLPASFYLSSKPSWWPAAKPWPAIGPDVSGGNIANVGGHAYTIPAADCYTNVMGGSSNGTASGALSFNASTCYASNSVQLPAPPTNLKAVVQ